MSLPAPAFDRAGVRLYHGDAREIVRHLEVTERTVCVTDPVWPNSGRTTLAGREDPAGLFADVIGTLVGAGLRRLTPLPFIRLVNLRYARPSYNGRIVNGADVAYVFGDFAGAYKGQRVWPGEIVSTETRAAWPSSHPCPRRLRHVRGLLVGYCQAEDHVLDPFAGSCTTLAAAIQLGREADGIEIDRAYVDEATSRLRDLARDPEPSTAGPLFAARLP